MALETAREWRIRPYPHPYRFGFTIVHDADSAYSKRLEPVLATFEELGLRITVTVFPFWAAWARGGQIWDDWRREDAFLAPVAVPLEDEAERAFYARLADSGHEIAMHTPSETSSTREQLAQAFELFESVFGSPPRMYVEHSPGNNLDAQQREGSNPESPYYNTDLLNDSRCWIWVLDEIQGGRPPDRSVTNLLRLDGAPFTTTPRSLYGVVRGFLRNGDGKANGDAFLQQYTEGAIDHLEAEEGLAILYTHLNYGWLNPETRSLRKRIRDRLTYLTDKPGWFPTGSDVLDRFAALRHVHLAEGDAWLKVVNAGDTEVRSLVLLSRRGRGLADDGGPLPRGEDEATVVDLLRPGETKTFRVTD